MPKKEMKLKAPLGDPFRVRKKLKKIGKLLGEEETTDFFFSNPNNENIKDFRLRKEKRTKTVQFKVPLETNSTQINEEYEFKISDPEEFTKFLELSGYREEAIIRKTSEIYNFKDMDIRLSEVESLGCFIELTTEMMGQEAENVRAKLLTLLSELGIPETDIDNRYYSAIKNSSQKAEDN